MARMTYQIGIVSPEREILRGEMKPNQIKRYSMSPKFAPNDWHSKVLLEFSAESWALACEYADKVMNAFLMNDQSSNGA